MPLTFTKMHGLGNDFVLIDGRRENLENLDPASLAKGICDRHFGIGADGLLIVLPSEKADVRMRIFNPDGSEAEMCGNGIRCLAKYLYDGLEEKKEVISVETLAGIMVPALIVEKGQAIGAEVDMGIPETQKPEEELEGLKVTLVSMGNPHCVIFVEDVTSAPVETLGPKIENHSRFPDRTNVEFVQVVSDHEIKIRVWERGVGETLACGTGACAAVVAGVLTGRTKKRCIVHLPGGNLDIEWEEDNHVALRGPAQTVFEGRYFYEKS